MASMGDEERYIFDDDESDGGSESDGESDSESDDAVRHDPASHPPVPFSSEEAAASAAALAAGVVGATPAAAHDPSAFVMPPLTSEQILTPIPNPIPIPTLPPNGSSQLLLSSPSTDVRDSRRIFQKLWTDEDEIAILQGFLEFTTQRGTAHADYQYDTGPFFDQIRTRLQLDFNKNQVVEKLRRLKRKYRNAVSRLDAGKDSVFKSPHDRATFEISRKIWSSSFKRTRKRARPTLTAAPAPALLYNGTASVQVPVPISVPVSVPVAVDPAMQIGNVFVDAAMPAAPVEIAVKEFNMIPLVQPDPPPAPIVSTVEETVKSCISPLFKELINCVIAGSGGAAGILAGGLGANSPIQLNQLSSATAAVDERWKQQQILELEVFLKRTELVQEQIKAALEELRSQEARPSPT